MFTRVLSVLAALIFVSLITGCSDAPTAEYEASKVTLENARLAEAEQYAPEAFKEATDSLNSALVEINKQDGKFSLLRSYDNAKQTITVAQQLAEKAQNDAANEKEATRIADSVMIAEIEMLIGETSNMIATAPKGKGSRVDLKVMQADLDAASGALTITKEDFQKGNYLVAKSKLTVVKSQVEKIKSDIEIAISQVTKK